MVSEREINIEKVQNSVTYLAAISLFISPSLDWYICDCKKLFGVKSAAEGSYKNKI